jgi:hypothetical protein
MKVIKAALIFLYVFTLIASMELNMVQYRNVKAYKEQVEMLVMEKRNKNAPSMFGECEKIIAAANIGGAASWSLIDLDKDSKSDLLMVSRFGHDTDVYTLFNWTVNFVGRLTGDMFFTFKEEDGSIGLSAKTGYDNGVGGIRIYHLSEMSYFTNEERYDYCYLPAFMEKPDYSCDGEEITEEEYNNALNYYCADENAIEQHEYTDEDISKYLYKRKSSVQS